MGKRHLLTAYEALGGDQACPLRLEITRRPYFLAPRMLGQTLEESGPNRVWGRRWSTDEDSPVMQLGREAGFSFNRDAIMSDTMRSHRLILFAAKRGKGETMADVLATLYFEEGQPLADTATLLEAARVLHVPFFPLITLIPGIIPGFPAHPRVAAESHTPAAPAGAGGHPSLKLALL